LEKVWASNTSLTATAMNNPRKVEAAAISTTTSKKALQSARTGPPAKRPWQRAQGR
jgi:hypothetical protein